MSLILNPRFIGSHFWLSPLGAAFTSPAAGNVTQDGAWPDENEPSWAKWALGIVESCSVDPKLGNGEVILAPSPGAVKARDKVIPYAIPECSVKLLQLGPLAFQLALNTETLFASANTAFTPNGGGGPGIRGIIRAQHYDENNKLILNFVSWAFIELKSAIELAPKTLTKPDFLITLLDSPNNDGECDDNI